MSLQTGEQFRAKRPRRGVTPEPSTLGVFLRVGGHGGLNRRQGADAEMAVWFQRSPE